MNAVWKFPILTADREALKMPRGAKILSVQTQGGNPCIWALVDESAPKSLRKICTFGTGHAIDSPERLTFLGTYQLQGGGLVFHVFEEDAL